MIKSYFKIAWRNLLKDKQFTLLNLLGLSSGLACALLIFLWVNDELSVDKFNKKDSQLYQVLKTSPNADGTVNTQESTQGLLAQSMAKDLPEIEYAVAVRSQDIGIVSYNNKFFKASSQFVEKDFLNIFSYNVIEGNKSTVFSDKYGVVISDKLALKLFNTTENAIGKSISWERGQFSGPYKVSGVFASPPSNATQQFDMLFTFEQYLTKEAEDIAFWGSNGVNTFLTLKKETDISQFNQKIKNYTKEKIKSLYKNDGMLAWEGDIFVQRYSEKYLHNRYENGVQAGGRIEYVRLFSIIAIFILVIACINFMNLSTAKAAGRMKETGIKKVMGAGRGTLILQYMSESIIMAFLALIAAIVIASLLLPAFREITGKSIGLDFNLSTIITIALITFTTGVLSGSYPALYLSGFRPAKVLKGKLQTSVGESWIRKGLVVFQFSISVFLIVAVMVVQRQMSLVQKTNLGYNKDNIIRFANDGKLKSNSSSFISELKSIPGVTYVTGMSGDFFGNADHSGSGINWEGKDPNLGIEYYGIRGGNDFFETLNLQIVEGRQFSSQFADSNSVIFNETAIATMGIKNPIGKTVSMWRKNMQIVGIAKDYHFESLYKKITPSFITFSENNDYTLVKIKNGNERQTILSIEKLYKQFNQGLAFEYRFIDNDYQKLYSSEQRVAELSRYFAGIAILISCLGLFGLAAFTAHKRQKEIGIRKVVGASMSGIALMLSKDFLKLVLIAVLIAFPAAWLIMNQWLQSFAYRVSVGAGIFFIAGVAIILVTLLTISFQSIKAAMANPVRALRSE